MEIIVLVICYYLLAEVFVFVLSLPNKKPMDSFDFIMVLGANGDLDSPVTRDRALNAALAKEKYPQARFLLTGNESRGEVSAYKNLLAEHGYLEFLIEVESRTTWENLKFSKHLLHEEQEPKILIVTSEYHQPRALAMARCLGLQADVFGKDPRKYQKALLYKIKERLSNMRYLPQMFFNFLIH